MRYLILAPALLVGCAATPQQMASESSWNVCYHTLGGASAQVARDEVQRRGLDCTPMYPSLIAQKQREDAALSNLIRQLSVPRAAAPVPAAPINCRTVYYGNTATTQCF